MESSLSSELIILEQPTEMFRFRYKSEMQGTHGSLNGERSRRNKKSFPEVELKNFKGSAVIRCSLYQIDKPLFHPHRLIVQKEDSDICDPHHLHVSPEEGYIARFENTGIIQTAKKDICNELFKKKKIQLQSELGHEQLSNVQEESLRHEAVQEAKQMDLNKVRLCFEAFQIVNGKCWRKICAPVFSRTINNSKSALTGELKICALSNTAGRAAGGDDLIILVEKISKNNIKVRFYEFINGKETWEAFGYFTEANVHHQYAILLQTPAYKDKYIDSRVQVFIELVRDSDNERSPPVKFVYKPQRETLSSSASREKTNLFDLYDKDAEFVSDPDESAFMQNVSDNIDEVNINMFQINETLDKVLDEYEFQKDGVENQNLRRRDRLKIRQFNMNIQEYRPTLNLLISAFNNCHKVGLEKTIKQVLRIFEDFIADNDNGDSIVHEIVRRGNNSEAKVILKILSKLNLVSLLSRTNNRRRTPLHEACIFDQAVFIHPLLGLKCDPNIQDVNGNTALHIAIANNFHLCIESLVSHTSSSNFDMNLSNDDGLTSLHLAIRNNNNKLAKFFLTKYNALSNFANSRDGNNALHMAIQQQSKELIKIVLENSIVELNTPNLAGLTPIHLAKTLKGAQSEEILDLLHEYLPLCHFPTATDMLGFIKNEDDDDKTQLSSGIKEEDEEIDLRRLLHNDDVCNQLGKLLNVDNKWKKVGSWLKLDHLVCMWGNFESFLKYVIGVDDIKPLNLLYAVQAVDEEAANLLISFMKSFKYNALSNMAKLIDGKAFAAEVRGELNKEVKEFTAAGNRPPQLTVILVGDDAASQTYVKNKVQAAKDVGVNSITKHLSVDIKEQELLDLIDRLNKDNSVDAILVQLPLPDHIRERVVCNAVCVEKDVDGFNEINVGRMCLDMKSMVPCTPLGVQELLKRSHIETFGKNAVVVGRSKNVGMPIAMLLHADGRNETSAMDATVTVCHRFTPAPELAKYCKLADIIITATGIPGLIKADMVKEGACVIDVGITRITDANGKSKLVGDVDFDEVRKVAGYITPVPGGVGPMTVAMLMRNTLTAAKRLAEAK